MIPDTDAHTAAADRFVQKNLRWNFMVNLGDGALFSLGTVFFSSATVLPLYVRHLTTSSMLVGLIAAIANAGWYLPQLLTARLVEGRTRRLPLVLGISANERFPVLLLGISVLLWPAAQPTTALAIFFLFLTWQSIGGGLTAPGWVDLLARVMPVNRRGRLLGWTNLSGSAMGVAGAALVAVLLAAPFPFGYGYTFLAGATCFLLSWALLALNREPPLPAAPAHRPIGDYWRGLAAQWRRNRNLRLFLLARVPGILGAMANSFIAVYAVRRFALPDDVAGGFTAALMIAAALANPVLGAIGDRFGHKMVMELHTLAQCLALACALAAPSAVWFYVVFALQGIGNAGWIIATISIVMEFGEGADIPSITAIANTFQGIFYMVSPLLGGAIVAAQGYRAAFWIALVAGAISLVALWVWVREPRHHGTRRLPARDAWPGGAA